MTNVVNTNLKNFPGLVAFVSTKGKFLDISDGFAKYIGYTSAQNLLEHERSYYDIRTKVVELSDVFFQEDKKVIINEESVKTVTYGEFQDGMRWVLDEKQILRDSNGLISGVFHNLIDVSETELPHYFNKLLFDNKSKQLSYTLKPSFDNKFSIRESECLYYILRGQSAAMTAAILQISKRTVESYLEIIKIKLNCFSKTEVIEKSLALGYYYVIPNSILKR